MSIGRRLSLLVLSGILTAAVAGLAAFFTLHRLSDEYRYMRGYVFAPLVAIGDAMSATAELGALANTGARDRAQPALGRVRLFFERYQERWQVVGSGSAEAVRFRRQLERMDRAALLSDERLSVDALEAALRAAPLSDDKATEIQSALVRLNDVNVRFMQVGYDAYEASRATLITAFLAVAALGMAAAPLFGLNVHCAIVPRVRRLVQKIERFREFGVNEPVGDCGGDELSVLARTLDVGFAAIAARDEDRKRFLAIAAHELKTPLTTMKGFARVALDHRDDPALRDHALAVVDRQATRVARLAQDLLWTARAQTGSLPFRPSPVDLAALTRRVIGEVAIVAPGHAFPFESGGDAHMLGDPALLEHCLFSTLMAAATMAPMGAPVPVTLDTLPDRARIRIESPDGRTLPDDLDTLLEPFAALQFEGMGEHRCTGLGLHLAREIARLHGASLGVERRLERGVVFTLVLGR